MQQTTVEGTLNILRQAEKASIEKVVVTGSFGNVIECKWRRFFSTIF